jgi:protein-S-isoprenylcysteine O-methyltransferase Ste14
VKPRRVNPPHYFLLALAAMWLLSRLQGPAWPPGPWSLLGIVPLLAGIGFAFAAARRFSVVGTNIVPLTRSSALVTDGPFAYTRNPMYLGLVLTLVGVALLLACPWPWFVIPAYAILLQLRFIRHEERLMADTFGAAYEAYRERTRRWI